MAKLNKYWGLVAVGAATAAAAGAIAAILLKKDRFTYSEDPEEVADTDNISDHAEEEKTEHELFQEWDDAASENDSEKPAEDTAAPAESEETAAEDTATEDTAASEE